jgi:hypothetical protein
VPYSHAHGPITDELFSSLIRSYALWNRPHFPHPLGQASHSNSILLLTPSQTFLATLHFTLAPTASPSLLLWEQDASHLFSVTAEPQSDNISPQLTPTIPTSLQSSHISLLTTQMTEHLRRSPITALSSPSHQLLSVDAAIHLAQQRHRSRNSNPHYEPRKRKHSVASQFSPTLPLNTLYRPSTLKTGYSWTTTPSSIYSLPLQPIKSHYFIS